MSMGASVPKLRIQVRSSSSDLGSGVRIQKSTSESGLASPRAYEPHTPAAITRSSRCDQSATFAISSYASKALLIRRLELLSQRLVWVSSRNYNPILVRGCFRPHTSRPFIFLATVAVRPKPDGQDIRLTALFTKSNS